VVFSNCFCVSSFFCRFFLDFLGCFLGSATGRRVYLVGAKRISKRRKNVFTSQ
jgi:hypothetical protein